MSKPWGVGIGNWAAEVERAESEEQEAAAQASSAGASVESQSFPSLREAVREKPKKKKMSLNEFYSSSAGVGAGPTTEFKGLTTDEMLRLPTGPRERSSEEMQYGRLGDGFANYSRTGPPPARIRDRDDTDGSWGGARRQYGGFDDDRRGPPRRVSDYDQPSRADEVDNWEMAKKQLASFDPGRQARYGALGGGVGGGSRADEVDNWNIGKKSLPARSSTFGLGFRESRPEPERWTREPTYESVRERPRLVLDPPKGEARGNESPKAKRPNPFGAARPREEVLAEKGLDWKKLEMEMEAKKTSTHSSRPTSAHSSRPSSAHSSRSEGPGLQLGLENVVSKPRQKVNPFGHAKPREVLLEERGQDWRKIDLELDHRRVDRPESEEEKILKNEIDNLKEELQKELTINVNRESLQRSGGDQSSLQCIISEKEKELEVLIRDLDDKVRFGQKAVGRPGSGAGRDAAFPERLLSQSGSFEDSKSVEVMDRPRSRGTQDISTRPVEGRRTFQGGRERGGFLGSRDFDRPMTGERW